MKSTVLNESSINGAQWIVFGRDPEKPEKIIDTNQYMVLTRNQAMLLDPGGIEIFPAMLSAVIRHAPLDRITHIFASHQDPDIISSLGLWDRTLPQAKLHCPWLWEGFVRHFGCENVEFVPIPDEGASVKLDGLTLQFVPAHYLHSSANFHVYDPEAKILMSGDIGAALEKGDVPMFVEDFASHIQYMRYFHQRWMPSNKAKNAWIKRVRGLDIEIMAPQHGRLFRGDDIARFLDWFEALDVGIALDKEADAQAA